MVLQKFGLTAISIYHLFIYLIYRSTYVYIFLYLSFRTRTTLPKKIQPSLSPRKRVGVLLIRFSIYFFLYFCLLIYVSIYLNIYLLSYLSINIPIYLSIKISIYLSHLYIYVHSQLSLSTISFNVTLSLNLPVSLYPVGILSL